MASNSLIALPETTTLVDGDEILVSSGGQAGDPRRAFLSTLGAAIAKGAITLAAGSLVASAPLLHSQTWNNVAVTFTGIRSNITDTASAAASLLIDLQVGGVSKLNGSKIGQWRATPSANGSTSVAYSFIGEINTGMELSALNGNLYFYLRGTLGMAIQGGTAGPVAVRYAWASAASASADILLERDAANTLAQRNGTNAQAFRIYDSYTDASNYRRGGFRWSANLLYVQTDGLGTGVNPTGIVLNGSGTNGNVYFQTNDSTRWVMGPTGHLTAGVDNTYDIGASGATRPRTGYFGTSIVAPAAIVTTIALINGTKIRDQGDGILQLGNNANNDFNRMQFGGTAATFPALKRSATILQARLADDSAFAPLQGELRTAVNAVTGLVAGALAATTNASIVVYDASGQAYRIPCII